MKMNDMNELTYQLNPEGRPADAPALFAYLVNPNGETIETQSVSEKGVFRFKSKPESLHGARVLLAPEMPDKDTSPTLDDLRDFNAYEPALKSDPKSKLQQIESIPTESPAAWGTAGSMAAR